MTILSSNVFYMYFIPLSLGGKLLLCLQAALKQAE